MWATALERLSHGPFGRMLSSFRRAGAPVQAFAATWGSDGVLYLEGELDLDAEAAAVGALRGRSNDEDDVVVDLSRLTFMDSTCIRVFQSLAGPASARVVLRSPSRCVRRVLELVGIAGWPTISVRDGAPASASHEDPFIFSAPS